MDAVDSPPRSRASGRSGPRTKLGCLTCRRRKVRCDQPNPAAQGQAQTPCSNCSRLKLDCCYPPPGVQRRRSRKLAEGTSRTAKTTPIIRPDDGSSVGPSDRPVVTDVGTNGEDPSAVAGSSSQCAPSWQQAMFMAPSWLPPSDSDPQPQLDLSQLPDYYLQHDSPEQVQFDRVYGGMVDFSGFPTANETQWQTMLPPSTLSPTGGLFLSSLLPWKDLPSGFDSTAGNNGNRSVGQVQRYSRSSTANAPRRQSAPASSSSTPMPTRPGSDRTPRTRSANVDLALFDVTERQRYLLHHFNPVSNPIPLIAPIDSQWKSAYSSLLNMACNCPYLINAICAVSELHLSDSGGGSVEQAFGYYQSASNAAEAVLGMDSSHTEDRTLKRAFATLFLLMRAEIMAQPLAGPRRWQTTHLRTAYRRLKQHNERLRSWTGIGSHILSWIQIIDSKAVYAAGMETEIDRPSPDTNVPTHASPSGTTTDTINSARCGSPDPSRSVHLCIDAPQEPSLDALNPVGSEETASGDEYLSAAEIAYDALNRPAYRFFLRCQSFIPRIIALDRHHRPRGSLDAEFEVLRIGQVLRGELRDLWVRRPVDFNVLADSSGLLEVLHRRVAQKIIRSFGIYIAHFHAIRILLHRVAFINYPATDEVQRAIAEIMRLAGDQIVAQNRESSISDSAERTEAAATTENNPTEGESDLPAASNGAADSSKAPAASLAPGSAWLWPLFMCGLECSLDEREWVLARMYDMKGSVNAERTAMLLKEVTKRQDERDERVDQRSVRQDIFGDDFSVVY